MWLTRQEIEAIGFRRVGDDVRISDRAVFYHPGHIEIGNHVRIDDFCMVSHCVTLGDHVFLAAQVMLLAGFDSTIELDDFCTMAWRSMIFTETDDYTGRFLTNPTVPMEYRGCTQRSVRLGRHTIVGAGATVLPGADLAEGTSIGAMALVPRPTQPWTIYAGVPACPLRPRDRGLLELETKLLAEEAE